MLSSVSPGLTPVTCLPTPLLYGGIEMDDDETTLKEILLRLTGEGATPPSQAPLWERIERTQKEINEAQLRIHDTAYALLKLLDAQSQRLTVQSVSLAQLRDECLHPLA